MFCETLKHIRERVGKLRGFPTYFDQYPHQYEGITKNAELQITRSRQIQEGFITK
jgi:hypothetical protein